MLLLPILPARSFTTLLILILSPGFLNTLWNDMLLSRWLYSKTHGRAVTPHCTLKKAREVPVQELKPGECLFYQSFQNAKSSGFFKECSDCHCPRYYCARELPVSLFNLPDRIRFPSPGSRWQDVFLRPARLPVRMATPPCIYLIEYADNVAILKEAVRILFFCCKDCGLDCSFQATGMNEQEIARTIIQHMDSAHSMKVIPADFMIKIKYAIKNKSAVKTVSLGPAAKPLVVILR